MCVSVKFLGFGNWVIILWMNIASLKKSIWYIPGNPA